MQSLSKVSNGTKVGGDETEVLVGSRAVALRSPILGVAFRFRLRKRTSWRWVGAIRDGSKPLGLPDSFQADFSFLLGASFADPNHAATLGTGRLFIHDKFDHLAAP